MKARLERAVIAMRIAKELKDGEVVNLGNGIPVLVANYVGEEKTVIFHSEIGVVGYSPSLTEEEWDKIDPDYITAGGLFITAVRGTCFVDAALSFLIARGGHLDVTVLGALQVSERGDLANWCRDTEVRAPEGMGGAMDMVTGAKKVIAAMEHVSRSGMSKILKRCTYPLTAKECVDLIVTDLAVIEVTKQGLLLKEIAPDWTVEEVQALTEPELLIAEDLKEMEL